MSGLYIEQLKTFFCLIKNIKQSVLQWPALWFPYLDQVNNQEHYVHFDWGISNEDIFKSCVAYYVSIQHLKGSYFHTDF